MRVQGGVRWGLMLLLMVVLAGLAGGGFWWWRERNREYLLRFQPKVGDTMRYFYEMNLSAQGQSYHVSVFATQKVLKAQKNGLLAIETRLDSGMIKANGGSMAMPAMPPQVDLYRPNGRRVNSGKVVSPIGQFTDVGYPDKPVKIGSTWSERQTAQDGSAIEAQFKVVGRERVGTKETLKIAITVRDVTSPTNAFDMMSGHIWVDLEKGIPVKVDVQFHQVRVPMMGIMTLQGSLKGRLVSP